ncbi:MAG: hypothetical protein R3Y13_04305 [bacterium]
MDKNYYNEDEMSFININELNRTLVGKYIDINMDLEKLNQKCKKSNFEKILLTLYSDYVKWNIFYEEDSEYEVIGKIKSYEDLIQYMEENKFFIYKILKINKRIVPMSTLEKGKILSIELKENFYKFENQERLIYKSNINFSEIIGIFKRYEIQLEQCLLDYKKSKNGDLEFFSEIENGKLEYLERVIENLICIKYFDYELYLENFKMIFMDAMYVLEYNRSVDKCNVDEEEVCNQFYEQSFDELLESIIEGEDIFLLLEVFNSYLACNIDDDTIKNICKLPEEVKQRIRKKME